MEENSYAANGVKHCVRPCDMTGKSAAVILRQMHHQVVVPEILYRMKQQDSMKWSSSQIGLQLSQTNKEAYHTLSKSDENQKS